MDERLGQVLEAVYATAVETSAWPGLLSELSSLFHCHFADAFARTHDFGMYRGVVHGLDPADYQDVMLDTWVKRNVWSAVRPVRRSGEVVTTRDMVTPAELMRSEMYVDYLGPRGLAEGLRLDIWAGDGWVQDISLLRSWSSGPYEPRELNMARTLLPHIQRAASIARRLDDATVAARAGFDALDGQNRPMFLTDATGRLLHTNRAADAMLAEGDILATLGVVLRAGTPQATDALQGLLGRAAVQRESGHMHLPHHGAAMKVTAMPVTREGRFGELRGPTVMLLAEPAPPPAAELTAMFDLTEAEAAVAKALLDGHSAAEIAASTGRSVNTVRSHLARLMQKTGTRRQAALVRALMQRPLPAQSPIGPRFN